MNKQIITSYLAIVAIALLLCSPIVAQTYLSQEGRLLDANNRIGSFGLNAAVPTDTITPRINSYITGNVTGGARFQGIVPYSSPYEMNANLGSSTLSNFRRDSVGRNNLSRTLQGAQFYVESSSAVSSSYGRVVGTAGTANQIAPAYQPPSSTMAREMANRPLSYTNYSPLSRFSALNDETPIFQAAAANPSAELTKRFQPWMMGLEASAASGQADQPNPNLPRTAFVTRLPDDQAGNTQAQQSATAPGSIQPTPFESATQPEDQPAEFGETVTPRTPRDPLNPNPAPDDQDLDTSEPAPAVTSDLYTDPESSRHLADAAHQQYQYFMERGYQHISQGRYYQAVTDFETAAVYQHRDPLATLAKSYALFAAGEFMSASFYLELALNLDPQLILRRTDLTRFFNDPAEYEKRLTDIERWQTRSDNPSLIFLYAYLLYTMERDAQALPELQKAVDLMPDNIPAARLLEHITNAPANNADANN